MNTRARVAAWLANYECGGCTAATFEDAADELLRVIYDGLTEGAAHVTAYYVDEA